MKYLIPVFMGSEGDMDFAGPVFEEMASYGISYQPEIISGEKAAEKCLMRVKRYDGGEERTPYLTIVGMANTMGPMISGATINPVVTVPKGSREELGIDMWSSLRRPRDSPLITVLGDPEASAFYMAKIVGLGDGQTRRRIREKKGVRGFHQYHSFPVIFDSDASDTALKEIESKFLEFGESPEIVSWDKAGIHAYAKGEGEKEQKRRRPMILVSKLSSDAARTMAETAGYPLIVTTSYSREDIPELVEDAGRFLDKNRDLPVGIALSPKNAVLAALKIDGLVNRRMAGRLKKYFDNIRKSY